MVVGHEAKSLPRQSCLLPRELDPLHSLRVSRLINLALTSKEGAAYTLGRPQSPKAAVFYVVSDWDSRHFGVKIARLGLVRKNVKTSVDMQIKRLLKRALAELSRMGVDCVIARSDLADLYVVDEFEQMGFQLKDVLVTFKKELREFWSHSIIVPGLNVRTSQKSDIAAICRIAGESFRHGHYHQDERLERRRSQTLYVRWANEMCRQPDHRVLVGTIKGKAVGFIACKLETELRTAVIELVSVDRNFRKRGIGSALIQHASGLFVLSARSLYAGTQVTDIAPMITYVAAGFRPAYSEATLHGWLT